MKNHDAIRLLLKEFGYDAAAQDCNEGNAEKYATWIARAFFRKVTLIDPTNHTATSYIKCWKNYCKAVHLLRGLGYRVALESHTLRNPEIYEMVKSDTIDYVHAD